MAAKVAIIGGGIAGSSVALFLAQEGYDITLFEQESSLVSGPPMCHLHAGGNLYPDISDEQCIKLLKQSIELIGYYPHAIDYRPTLITYPKSSQENPKELHRRLEMLQNIYKELTQQDRTNKRLGEPENYYKSYSYKEAKALQNSTLATKEPRTLDEWMMQALREIDLEKLQYPLFIVQEYGLNLFRIAASAELMLQKLPNVTLKLATKAQKLSRKQEKWLVNEESFDYLINAAGFRSGIIDDLIGKKRSRLVEFKAAYVSRWEKQEHLFPEIIFQGKRGTPEGMGQFTPYPAGYYQLHGMTQDITLYPHGLVKSSPLSAQPKLSAEFLQKIEQKWEWSEVEQRTKAAIKHISRFMPSFKSAKVAAKPLYGAQQIPGDDATLRASEVSFESENYARCETVKASSVFTMAKDIAADMQTKELTKATSQKMPLYTKEDVDQLATQIAASREYPKEMAGITTLTPSS